MEVGREFLRALPTAALQTALIFLFLLTVAALARLARYVLVDRVARALARRATTRARQFRQEQIRNPGTQATGHAAAHARELDRTEAFVQRQVLRPFERDSLLARLLFPDPESARRVANRVRSRDLVSVEAERAYCEALTTEPKTRLRGLLRVLADKGFRSHLSHEEREELLAWIKEHGDQEAKELAAYWTSRD